jgi:3-deoxy-7-phosphoheptulonate synthase
MPANLNSGVTLEGQVSNVLASGRSSWDAPPEYSMWDTLPALQQPDWRRHPAYGRTRQFLASASPLVTGSELHTVQQSMAAVCVGKALMLQLGDCAESFFECTLAHTAEKLDVCDRLSRYLEELSQMSVTRVCRIAGQFAKPRSKPTEWHAGRKVPSFRGHLVNSEVPTKAARQHDPRRMLWAYQASGKVLGWLTEYRESGERGGGSDAAGVHKGPWSSHEALVIDYEACLVRTEPATGVAYLSSTHIPWIGARTNQPDHAHARLLAGITNPIGCKISPDTTPEAVLRLCDVLNPERRPGRLILIARMGHAVVEEALPPIVDAVGRAGHPVIWLSDPMHANTITAASGLKTRRLSDIIFEAVTFREIVECAGQHAAGLHLEVAAADVTECIGCSVRGDDDVAARYTSLCDPRLNPEQALAVLDAWSQQGRSTSARIAAQDLRGGRTGESETT